MLTEARTRPQRYTRRQVSERQSAGLILRLLEEDRHRLARELHDEMGQILAVTLFRIDSHVAGLSPESAAAANELRDIRESLVHATRDLRRLVYRLHPPMLAELGLAPAMRWLVQQFTTQYRIMATLDALDECRLPPTMEVAVFRIVQEALTNVAKHSKARTVKVKLTASDEWVTASVEDDGQGFDANQIPPVDNPTFGFVGMRERAREFYGDVAVLSAPGKGTTVLARLGRKAHHNASDSRAAS